MNSENKAAASSATQVTQTREEWWLSCGRGAFGFAEPEDGSRLSWCAALEHSPEVAQLKRVEQVCYDIHAELGIKWGDDPYAAIRILKREAAHYEKVAQEAVNKLKATSPSVSSAQLARLRALFADHYWDSFSGEKKLIMQHVNSVLELAMQGEDAAPVGKAAASPANGALKTEQPAQAPGGKSSSV